MPDAFDAGLRALFRNPDGTAAAIYFAAEGAPPRALRVVVSAPSDAVQGNPLGRVVADSQAVQLLVADVPAKPGMASRLLLRGRAYRLTDATRDKDGRLWRAVLSGGTAAAPPDAVALEDGSPLVDGDGAVLLFPVGSGGPGG